MHITLHTTFPSDLKADWNNLLASGISHVPFLRYEYLEDWWQTRGGAEWPADAELAILTAHDADRLVGIAPFFIAQHEGQKRLLLLGCIEISDYLDLIVSAEDEPQFLTVVLEYVAEHFIPQGIRTLDLYNLLEDSPTLAALTEAGKAAGFTVTQTRLQQAPYIPLPGDWENYLESLDKKQRHEIRRKMRRAAEADPPATMYFANDPELLDVDAECFMTLMATDPEKEAFLNSAMRVQFKQSIKRAFECGCLQLAFLRIGSENAAAYLSFDYLNRIWVYNSGLDRRFMEYSPGWVLLGHLLQWANENKRSEFDFLRGNEDYKYKFGAVDRYVCRLTLGRS
jgi:CelD/BcsL family acetyltransferase involved in cellulose biosynthesis